MKLIHIYECFCDETRLRILNLLAHTPLCVSHLQDILQVSQVKVSKHLNYLKVREMVEACRCENWTVYSLPQNPSLELDANLRCLQDCLLEKSIFQKDLIRLKDRQEEIDRVKQRAAKCCNITVKDLMSQKR